MSINLRLCISFALLSFVSSPVLADKFNNVIDDFDSYQQLERNNRIETVPTKTQPYDDLFRDLPFEPAPKKRATVRKKGVKTKTATTKAVREPSAGTKTVEPVKPEQIVEKIQYINVPTYYLTSAPSLFKPGQWTPHYLYRDYDKYTIVYNPLNLFTYLPPASIISHSTKLNIEQLTNIVRIAEQHRLSSIFNLGTAQAVGQLVMYQNLLGNAEFVAEVTAKNRTVKDLNDQLSLKLSEIGKINASLTRANQRVASLEKQLSEKADNVSNEKFDELTKKLAAAINESSAKQEQIIKLAKDNEQIQQKIARTETQFADNLKIQNDLKLQLAEKEKLVQLAVQQLKDARGEFDQLKQTVETQRQMASKTNNEQVMALTANLKEQQAALKQKEAELAKMQKDNDIVRQQLARNSEQSLSTANKTALKISELERDVAAKKQLMDSQAALKKELESALLKQKTLETQLTQRNSTATETENKLKNAQADLVKLQQDIDKQRQVMAQASDKQVVALTASLKEQQTVLKQKEAELAKMQKDIDEVRQQLAKNSEQNLATANKSAQQISLLEQDVAAKKQLMDSQAALKKELESALLKQKTLETQLAQRATTATDTENKLKIAQAELVKLQQDIDKQRQVMAQASDKQVVALTSSLKEQQAAIKQKEAELVKLQKDNDIVRQQLAKNTEQSQSVVSKVTQQLKDKELQISQLEAATKKLVADSESELKKQLQSALVAQKMLETQLAQRAGSATEAEKQLKIAQAEVVKLQQEIDKQRQTIVQANDKQVAALTASLQEQQNALKKKEAELTKTLKSNDDFRQQLAQNTLNNLQAIQKYTEQVNEKQKLISQLEKDIAAKDKTVSKQSELEKQLQDAQAAQKALGMQLAEREKSANAAEKQLKVAQSELVKLQQDIDKQNKMMSQTNDKQVAVLSASLKEQQSALKQKEIELAKTQKENDAIRQQLTENARQNDLVSRQIKEKEQQIIQLESSIAAKNKTVGKQSELEKQLQISQAAQKTLEAQLSQRDKTASDAEKQLKATQAELAKLQQDIDKQRQVMSQTSDKQVTVLSASLKEQQTVLQQKEAELAKVRKDNEAVRQQLAQNTEQNKQIAQKIKEKAQLVELLEREIESKNKSTVKQAELEKRLADAKDNINKLTLESNKLRDVNAKFVAQSAIIELLKQQLNTKESGNDISSKELMIAKQDIDRLKTELEKQKTLSGNGVLNTKLDSQLEEANRKLAQLQKENDKLKTMSAAASSGSSASSPATTTVNRSAKSAANSANVAEDNKKKNKQIIADITKQKYNKLDVNTYYKILQQGKAVKNIANKKVSFMMREQLTDGSVTVMYTETNPVVLPYKELPAPLNTFIEKAGIGGVIKVYIKPEGGYGVEGIPGQIAPNSMSIIDLKLIKVE